MNERGNLAAFAGLISIERKARGDDGRMTAARKTEDLSALIGKLDRASKSNGSQVSVEEIMDAVGRRSFGPLLLLAGLLGMTPVAAVPTAPTMLALITLLVAGQLLFGRKSFWLPGPLLRLSVKAGKVTKAARLAKTPAGIVDRLIRPRLTVLTSPVADRVVAGVCVLIALCVPPLELLPFAAFIPSFAIFVFGLGLIARDGLLILIAMIVSAGALGLLGYGLLT